MRSSPGDPDRCRRGLSRPPGGAGPMSHGLAPRHRPPGTATPNRSAQAEVRGPDFSKLAHPAKPSRPRASRGRPSRSRGAAERRHGAARRYSSSPTASGATRPGRPFPGPGQPHGRFPLLARRPAPRPGCRHFPPAAGPPLPGPGATPAGAALPSEAILGRAPRPTAGGSSYLAARRAAAGRGRRAGGCRCCSRGAGRSGRRGGRGACS